MTISADNMILTDDEIDDLWDKSAEYYNLYAEARIFARNLIQKIESKNANIISNKIILRHAESDFVALMTAQAMENAGATVISFSPCCPKTEMMKFMVIARYNLHKTTIDDIDNEIEKLLYGEHDN